MKNPFKRSKNKTAKNTSEKLTNDDQKFAEYYSPLPELQWQDVPIEQTPLTADKGGVFKTRKLIGSPVDNVEAIVAIAGRVNADIESEDPFGPAPLEDLIPFEDLPALSHSDESVEDKGDRLVVMTKEVMDVLRVIQIIKTVDELVFGQLSEFTAYDVTMSMRKAYPGVMINHNTHRDTIHKLLDVYVRSGVVDIDHSSEFGGSIKYSLSFEQPEFDEYDAPPTALYDQDDSVVGSTRTPEKAPPIGNPPSWVDVDPHPAWADGSNYQDRRSVRDAAAAAFGAKTTTRTSDD